MGGWKVKGKEEYKEIQCSFIKSPTIYVEHTPRQKIELLMAEYPHQEWLGYLVGEINADSGDIFVTNLFIPPHVEASAGSAEAEPFHIPNRCVGIIHSHHGMGAFHSSTDKDYVDGNYPISITVAKRGDAAIEYDAISYVTTPCGVSTVFKCTVMYVTPKPTFNTKRFMDKAKEQIEKARKVYTPPAQAALAFYGGYGYGQDDKGFGDEFYKGNQPYVPWRYRADKGGFVQTKADSKGFSSLGDNGKKENNWGKNNDKSKESTSLESK